MTPKTRSGPARVATLITLILLAGGSWLSNSALFRQEVQGTTDLTRNIPGRLGSWTLVAESPVTASEIRGLETRDVVKRTYTDGRDVVELVVAYIAHSSRKSAHAQEACLRGSGALVSRIHARKLDRTPILAKSISLDLRNQKQRVYYWYKIGDVHTSEYLKSSLMMFLGGLAGKDSRGASLVRLLTPERLGEPEDQINKRLEDFAFQLLPALQANLP